MKRIKARFANGREAFYTVEVLKLMMTDKYVVEIMDMETGEILKA